MQSADPLLKLQLSFEDDACSHSACSPCTIVESIGEYLLLFPLESQARRLPSV